MKCVKCGKEISPDAKFCRFCGAKAEAVPAPKKRFCTECGTELVENAKFCKKCGARVSTAVRSTAPAAGVTIPAKETVTSVTVSDEPPAVEDRAKSGAAISSKARRAAEDALRQVIARLTDGDCNASAIAGEMNLPLTEAQSTFMKLISKGI